MQESQARILIEKYRKGTLTDEERILLESWYLKLAEETELAEENAGRLGAAIENLGPPAIPERKTPVRPLLKWAAVAASVLILVSLAIVYRPDHHEETVVSSDPLLKEDALPGQHRATLTLADGSSIPLEKTGPGVLVKENRVSIVKTGDGEIACNVAAGPGKPPGKVSYNKLETPKAGQYRVILPDGTRAWLNAASSIRFPALFPAGERVVEISGEVYFEVAKLRKNGRNIPFRVRSGVQTVEVLGTVFNVNGYADEETTKTTLLEGSIRVIDNAHAGETVVLKPGQQTLLSAKIQGPADSPRLDIKEVDTGSVVAWKEGYFRFDGVGLPELMRQLSRWYDMEVVYETVVADHEFVGRIERDANLSKVLRILELGGVRFRIEGKKIIVTD
ncbi:MAG: hypothetical protein ABS46_06245 [Cytophagaceae bacterium SCN 52-12]|nr:MAG: hypothetical protein ABS46_06245 [Cytophagaceae bacterium SCN 52-12]